MSEPPARTHYAAQPVLVSSFTVYAFSQVS